MLHKQFPEAIIQEAWDRSGDRCECERKTCGHAGRCPQKLLRGSRGAETEYGWEAHHINSEGPNTLSNCQILCQECHKNTETYGE